VPFEVALCGQRYGRQPAAFTTGIAALGERIVHTGYADAETYKELLWAADVVISTAVHEFFGISILEAIHCHTFPLLPDRLSYPELIPAPFHDHCLYDTEPELAAKLRWALRERRQVGDLSADLATHVGRFSWRNMAAQYDQSFATLCL
jgi:glycosyltransferase involved in cell wall biosynthesis